MLTYQVGLRLVGAMLSVALLAGCAVRQPVVLPDSDALATSVESLLAKPGTTVQVQLADGLAMNEVAAVAVAASPQLIAARAQYGVADAQLFATRLLPDPQFGLSLDRPTSGDASSDAFGVTAGYDVLALLTHGSTVRAERLSGQKLRLDVAWQEWQVAQQARLLYVRERAETRKLALLRAALDGYRERYAASSMALARGDVTVVSAGPDAVALADAESRYYQLLLQHVDSGHALRSLLGLLPQASLVLAPLPPLPSAPAGTTEQWLARAPTLRPDLLALQAGYASNEATLRTAVARFFPSIGIGFARLRDTSNVYTSGLSISLDLPVFAGNRGEVRVLKATRAQLHAEYLARLAELHADVSRLQDEREVLVARRVRLLDLLPELQKMVTHARPAWLDGTMDPLVFLDLERASIDKQSALIDVEQTLWEVSIALDTVIAAPLAE